MRRFCGLKVYDIYGYFHVIIMHGCGKIEPLLTDSIAAGLDVIQALQANTGMDVRELKKMRQAACLFWKHIGARVQKREENSRGRIKKEDSGGKRRRRIYIPLRPQHAA